MTRVWPVPGALTVDNDDGLTWIMAVLLKERTRGGFFEGQERARNGVVHAIDLRAPGFDPANIIQRARAALTISRDWGIELVEERARNIRSS